MYIRSSAIDNATDMICRVGFIVSWWTTYHPVLLKLVIYIGCCVRFVTHWLELFLILPQMITLGGDAELELVDSLDPFSEGVVFSVRPPKKSWKNIANLSGGEKVC